MQGLKIVLVRSYLRVSQAAGQVNILVFLLKIKFSPCMPINFVMQGKCLFSDILRPAMFTRHGLPMNRYTFVYFRKPKRFRAQMPTSTSRQSLKDIRIFLQRSADETLKSQS